jgi:hypothetical protein
VRVRSSRSAIAVTFYAALVLVIAGVLLAVFPLFLPDGFASRIGHNSEGLVLALVVAAWVQFQRPRLTAGRREWAVTGVAAAILLALGVALLLSDLPSRFRTLNETFLALALLIPYLQLRRPLSRRVVWGAAGVILLVVVLFNRSAAVTDLAETLGVLLLAPLAFDVVDRGILDPGAATSPRLRRTWYALLIAAPVCFSVLEYRIGVDGLLGEAVRYAVRITEAFVCLLLVELYFAVALQRTGRPVVVVDRAPAAALR